MLLAIDIGNSAIKFGVFDGEVLVSKSSIPTKRDYTATSLADAVGGVDHPVTEAIACSVVPQVDKAMRKFVLDRFGIETFFVDNTFDFSMTLKYETISTLGTDRLVNAFAAASKYGTPVIVCSLGTATTIDVVSEHNEYLGGVIAPGIQTMAEALHLHTAQLPQIEIEKPAYVIGTSTVTSIQAGVFYGYVSLIDGLIDRMTVELAPSQPSKVIATGGFAKLIGSESQTIANADENLLLDGLRLVINRRISLKK